MICPNKSTDEWKRLVAHLGSEEKAYVAYFRHQGKGLTGFPAPENATELVTKQSDTGIANAIIDKERAARGAEPLSAPARRDFGQVWDEASRAIDKNKFLPSELLTELSEKPRAISDLENAVLAHEKVRVVNEVEKAHVEFAEAQDSGDPAKASEARTRALALDEKLTQLDDLERTLRKVGTEQGRGLAARRMMVNRDYTLSSMLNEVRTAKGEALTPEEVSSVEGVYKKYKSAKEKVEVSDEERLSRQAEEHFQSEFEGMKESVSKDKTVPERDVESERKGIVDKIKASVNEGEPVENLSRLIQKLARNAVERGIKDRDKVLDDVATNLKDAGIEMDRSNLRDELSGYGKYKELSKDETDIELRRIKGELQQVGKLEDMAKGEAPKKTGTEKRTPSDEERRLIKLVNEEKRKGGFTVTDPARQLKTSLDSIKTRLRNQIKDLDQQVTTRTKILKNKTAPPTDPEVEALRVERDKLKSQYDEIFGKPELTDEQRIRMATAAVEKSIADLEARIKAGETTPKARVSKTPVTPELEALRAKRDALSSELQDLRNADESYQASKEAKALQESIDEYNRKTAAGEFQPDKKEVKQSPANDALRNKREEARKVFEAARDADPKVKQQVLDKALESAQALGLELERRINEGEIDAKKNPSKPTSPELELQREENKELRKIIDSLRRERDRKTPSEIEAKRLNDQIEEYNRKIKEKDFISAKKAPVETPENKALREKRDATKLAMQEARDADPDVKAAKAKVALEKAQALGVELQRRINDGEIEVSKKTPGISTPELDAQRAENAELQKILAQLRREATRKTPDEIALSRYKTRQLNRLAELLDKTYREDFSTRPKPKPIALDPAATRLAADVEKAKQLFEQKKAEYIRKNRTNTQKTLDAFSEWTRFAVLSSPKTIGKLLAASLWRFGSYAAEEGIGAGLSKIPGLSEIAKRAPSEGKGSLAIEAQSIAEGFTEGLKDAEQTLKTGKSGLDLLYGKKDVMPKSWLNWAGNLHGAIKAPIIRAAFTRSFAKRAEFLARQGVDVHDPMVQMGIATEAYKDAQRAAFKQDNRIVTGYNNMIRSWEKSAEQSPSESGRLAAKAGATAARVALPVVKVPMNIVAETVQNLVGTVTGSIEAGRAIAKGVETLKPEQADVIMRQLKKGLVGNAMLALGWYAYKSIGGFYERGRKPDEDEAKPGEVMVNGVRIPRQYLHSPAIEAMMYAANSHRVSEEFNKSTGEDKDIVDGLIGSSIGILEEVPFMDDVRTLERLTSAKDKSLVVGEFIKSRAIPQGITWAAQQLDKDENGNPVPRKPETFWQEFETSIPGLRQQVPEKR